MNFTKIRQNNHHKKIHTLNSSFSVQGNKSDLKTRNSDCFKFFFCILTHELP
jgi:hypothetical protein